jgi:hypothetical protein
MDMFNSDDARAVTASNCRYLEDKWRVTINPIIVCYKNETWGDPNRPPLTVANSPLPNVPYRDYYDLPEELSNRNYGDSPYDIDTTDWVNDIDIYGTNFGKD